MLHFGVLQRIHCCQVQLVHLMRESHVPLYAAGVAEAVGAQCTYLRCGPCTVGMLGRVVRPVIELAFRLPVNKMPLLIWAALLSIANLLLLLQQSSGQLALRIAQPLQLGAADIMSAARQCGFAEIL